MTVTFSAARQAKLLDLDDERMLIERWQKRRDSAALETLVLSHARMAFQFAHRLGKDRTEQEELVSEGLLALVRAADMFDLKHEVRFSTYARWWVKNGAMKALSSLRAVVEVPAGARAGMPWPKTQTLEEEDLQRAGMAQLNPEEQLIEKSSHDAMRSRVASSIAGLDPIDREVVLCRSMKSPPEDIAALAGRLGFTVEKLRQLERRAMMRLRYGLVAGGAQTSRVE